jgi:hypothetical protein
MARRKTPEELSVEELRRLLVEKRRGARKERLEHFRRTGRVLSVTPDLSDLDSHQSAPIVDTAESKDSTSELVPINPRRKIMDGILLGEIGRASCRERV